MGRLSYRTEVDYPVYVTYGYVTSVELTAEWHCSALLWMCHRDKGDLSETQKKLMADADNR